MPIKNSAKIALPYFAFVTDELKCIKKNSKNVLPTKLQMMVTFG